MLNSVKAQNFMSWGNLEFPITKGIKLVDGWNKDDQTSEGSGKSSVLNALSWAAYGKLPKDTKVDEVIKDGESNCEVTLSFSTGDILVRSRKPNDLYIKKFSGSIIKGKDARETQEMIDEYLGMNFETFCQSIYFAQNYDKKFLPANQEEKGKILSSIQKLSIFDKARKEVSELLKIETEKQSSLKNNIQLEENNLRNLKSQEDLLKSFIQDKTNAHKLVVQNLTNTRDSYLYGIKMGTQEVEQLQQQLSNIDEDKLISEERSLQEARPILSSQLAEVSYRKTQLSSIKKEILSKEQEGKILANKYNNLQTKKQNETNLETSPTYLRLLSDKKRAGDFQSSQSYIRLISKKSDLENYINNPSKICPSCGSELKDVDLSHIQKELDGINSELQLIVNNSAFDVQRISQEIIKFEIQFYKDLEFIDIEMATVLSQLQVISDYLDKNEIPKIEELEHSENTIKYQIKGLDSDISNIRVKLNEKTKLTNDLNLKLQKLQHDKSLYDKYNEELQNVKEPDIVEEYHKLNVINGEGGKILHKKSQLESFLFQSVEYAKQLEELKDGFKEIKTFVFSNALKELNHRANKYLTELFEVEATIKFTTNEDQKIEYNIVLDGQERSLGLLSGGQNRRFNLAVDLALSDLVLDRKSTQLNVLILDEYFKDLSEVSMEKCLDLLKNRKSPVVLIEHNSIFKNIVDNVFFVELENGTSYESRS